jgi:hypothetical protein
VVHLLDEAEDVAVLAAAEAVVPADLWPHMEARAALVVERAQALERADSSALEGDVVAHDVGDVDSRSNLVDVVSSNEAGHVLILGSVGSPAPRRGRPEEYPLSS